MENTCDRSLLQQYSANVSFLAIPQSWILVVAAENRGCPNVLLQYNSHNEIAIKHGDGDFRSYHSYIISGSATAQAEKVGRFHMYLQTHVQGKKIISKIPANRYVRLFFSFEPWFNKLRITYYPFLFSYFVFLWLVYRSAVLFNRVKYLDWPDLRFWRRHIVTEYQNKLIID